MAAGQITSNPLLAAYNANNSIAAQIPTTVQLLTSTMRIHQVHGLVDDVSFGRHVKSKVGLAQHATP